MHRVDADTFIPPQVTTFRGDSSGGYQTFHPQCRDAGEPTLPLEIWRIAVASYYYHGHSMREDKGIFYFFFSENKPVYARKHKKLGSAETVDRF